ncbi:MAG TPA: tetratricopeptide repeat protein, partial [Labilithrix sp.]
MRRLVLLLFLIALALATACSRKPKAVRHTPRSQAELPTTSADIWLGNLDGQIAELTRLVAARPDLLSNIERLSAAHHIRGRLRDDLDEIQEGIDLAIVYTVRAPDDPKGWLARAEQEQSLHRFPQAREDLARAKQLGAPAARVADLEADLDWNDGRYDPAIGRIRRARRERPSSATWLREAQLDHDLGDDDGADAAFAAAEDAIKDVSPLPVAHLDVQRGIVDVSRGRLEDAVVFFRAAVERMPTHVAALEHLGETLHMLGKDDEAVAIYEKVVKLSDDPEFSHALAVLYAARGKKDEAAALVPMSLIEETALIGPREKIR